MSRNRGPNKAILALGAAVLLPLVVLFAVSFGNDPRAVPSVLEGRPAPAFSLTALTGETVDLAALRGRPIVLNFWSTWCGPCKQEHPVLSAGPTRYPGVAFLGVVYADTEPKVRAYLQRAGAKYPMLLDPGGRVAVDYGVAGVPETYFIAPDGTITYKHAGPLNDALLRHHLTPLMAAAR